MALLIIGILLFLGLVITHELGHFLVAKRNGVVPEEFGIFFPPTLYRKKMKDGWDFTLNLLPLGGFVRLKGEHDSDTHKGSFGVASDVVKVKIMLAGVGVNLLTALILLTLLALTGMPVILDKQFTIKSDTKVTSNHVLAAYVEPHSPAEVAHINRGDVLTNITDISEQKMYTIDGKSALRETTSKLAGKRVKVTFKRGSQQLQSVVTLRTEVEIAASQKTDKPKGYLGIEPYSLTLQRSTWSAPIVATGISWQATKLTLAGLGHALKGLGGIVAGGITGNTTARQHAQTAASSQVSGPLGIFFVLKSGSIVGPQFMIMIIAIVSLTLAIMNVLPVPALDGGRLYLMLLSRLTKKKRLTQKMEETIVGWSFMLLIVLIVLITIVDVKRFF